MKTSLERMGDLASSQGQVLPVPFAVRLEQIDEALTHEQFDEVLDLIKQALETGWGPEALIRLESRRLRCLIRKGELSALDAVELVFNLLERAQALSDPVAHADVLVLHALVQGGCRMVAGALQSLGQAEALYESVGDGTSLTMARLTRASVLINAEMNSELVDYLVPIYAQQGASMPLKTRLSVVINLGAANSNIFKYHEAIKWYELALLLAEEEGSFGRRCRCRINLANCLIWIGDLDRAARMLQEVDSLMQDKSLSPEPQAWLFQNKALLAWKQGRHADAIQLFRQVVAMAQKGHYVFLLSRALRRMAECAEEAGDATAALQARREQVQLLTNNLRTQEQNFGQGLLTLVQHAKLEAQNSYLQDHGSQLERALAQRNRDLQETLGRLSTEVDVRRRAEEALTRAHGELEVKVEERTRELERAMRMLMEHEKQASLTYLVAGVAHELNTPVGNALLAGTSAQAALEQFGQVFESNRLRRQDVDRMRQSIQQNLDIVTHALERAAALVQTFKGLALEGRKDAIEGMDAEQVMLNTLQAFRTSLDSAGVRVDVSGLRSVRMRSYPVALGQALAQLLQNALLHAFKGSDPAGRCLSLRTDQHDRQAVIEVRDNGVGIPAQVQGRVFDPFFTTQLGQGSSGLGLHLVHQLVHQRLQGDIELESQPGVGTCMRMHLPLQVDANAKRPDMRSGPPEHEQGSAQGSARRA